MNRWIHGYKNSNGWTDNGMDRERQMAIQIYTRTNRKMDEYVNRQTHE